jgi:hypothetical protein
MRKILVTPNMTVILLWLQFVPLILFPLSSYKVTTQEWWLPAMLVVLALVGTVQLVVRRSLAPWPWYLISFSQGFNIISRLMMVMPHASLIVNGQQVFNGLYVTLSVISMLASAFYLWYTELPEVRLNVLPHKA